ncbi:bifunctional hydroxymethylpyrimidine kinase/phosphomethylpyrimidine kinase [Nitrincola alkalilacustris]|uniref:bifunctional hydroxymethylpyrimidine kinase/phosphomethylpyrimidine kinase n=1 Tax=Nitrincola alkalilacustris TaxID=1571224 RepID=UPI00124EE6BC|nr:bifunctional hydroxymethylpyrimidine kinase/phosphomethylpyrimidine kinase [Nitrincola alkalilacustris]
MIADTAIAMTLAGSDSGGGAGIQADLKTFSALGVFGASVITALTAQNTREVRAILPIPADFIRSQIQAVLDDLNVAAIKVGMLGDVATIECVAKALSEYPARPIVLDPVMIAKSGDALLQGDAINSLRSLLLPRASLITPNLPEAARLTDRPEPSTVQQMHDLLPALHSLTDAAILLKGGHLQNLNQESGNQAIDLFSDGTQVIELTSVRYNTGNTHGTGCTLSSAITAFLARQMTLPDAVRAGKHYISNAIKTADQLKVGSGHGPVNHFHEWWHQDSNNPSYIPN